MLSTKILKAVRPDHPRRGGCANRLRPEENQALASRLLVAYDEDDEGRNPEGAGGEKTGGEVLAEAGTASRRPRTRAGCSWAPWMRRDHILLPVAAFKQ